MNIRARTLVGGLCLSAAAVAMFVFGQHVGPQAPPGHNLYAAQAAGGGRREPALRLAAARTGKPTQVADNGNAAPAAEDPSADDTASDSPGATFQQVYYLLKRDYVEGVPDDSKLGHGAASAMLASLQDSASRFLEPAEMAELDNESKGEFHGIGAPLIVRKLNHPKDPKDPDFPGYSEYRLTVVTSLPGSPAARAGLQTGDVITDINGSWIQTYEPALAHYKELKAAGNANDPVAQNAIISTIEKKLTNSISLSAAQTKLDTDAAKPLTLTVERSGAPKPIEVTLDASAPTTITPVSSKTLPGNIGYIKITEFSQGADKATDTALAGLGSVKGLVLDLRDNPGGLLDVGSAVAGRLTTAHTLGIVETKGKHETPIAVTGTRAVACPVVVLVNGGTANTAELVASALRAGSSKIIGTTTFGDSSDVKPISLRDGSGFTMTIGKLLTASHEDFGGAGIKPDVTAAATAGADAPLTQAIGLLAGQVASVPVSRG